MIIIGYFFIISQLSDSTEHHKLTFKGELTNYLFWLSYISNLFWSTDKLGIYHVYRKFTAFCMKNKVIEKYFIIKVT